MKQIDLTQAASVLANLGVIAGIIFLALELRQNQHLVMAQTRNEIARMGIELGQGNSEPDQASLIVRRNQGQPLTPEERFRLNRWASNWLQYFENMEYQYRQGLFDEEEYRGQLSKMKARINSDDAYT